MTKSILVLGNGMLGTMARSYFAASNKYEVVCIFPSKETRFPDKEYKEQIESFDKEDCVIINAIGSIPQKTEDFSINYLLPKYLVENIKKANVIHPSTDCVFNCDLPLGQFHKRGDRLNGKDKYAESKIIADELILSSENTTKILRTSIIGIDSGSKSLLSWFLSQPKGAMVEGYINAFWNGITTLEWAKQAERLIENWDSYEKLTQISSRYPESKYDLLKIFQEVYQTDTKVLVKKLDKLCNKTLLGDIFTNDIKTQVKELKEFNK